MLEQSGFCSGTAILVRAMVYVRVWKKSFQLPWYMLTSRKVRNLKNFASLFRIDDLRGKMKCKNCQCIDGVFSIYAGYVNRGTGFKNGHILIEMDVLYSVLVGDSCCERRMSGTNDECIALLRKELQELETRIAE